MSNKANDIRVGNVIEYQGKLWSVLKKEHVKPGKGGAYVQVEMKDIKTGTKTNTRFNSTKDVEIVFVEQKNFQYQYIDKDEIMVMDLEDFEQVSLPKIMMEQNCEDFLQNDMLLTVEYCNDEPISIKLPEHIEVMVEQADATMKNQTSSSSYKNGVLENGVNILIPPFIKSGDKIIIRMSDKTYVEKAKK
jgi:elongation factor P